MQTDCLIEVLSLTGALAAHRSISSSPECALLVCRVSLRLAWFLSLYPLSDQDRQFVQAMQRDLQRRLNEIRHVIP